MVLAGFSNASGAGGESLTVSAAHVGPYTLSPSGWVASTTLVSGTNLLFVNVDPAGSGTTTVSASGNGTNSCSLVGGLTTWPVVPKAVLVPEVSCQ
jgi:hypothetical protein